MCCGLVSAGQKLLKGNVVHVANDVETTVRTLPLMLDDMDADIDADPGVSAQWGVCQGFVCLGGLPQCMLGYVCPGECLPQCMVGYVRLRECLSQCMLGYTHPCKQNDWQTGVKTLSCRNYVADGKNAVNHCQHASRRWPELKLIEKLHFKLKRKGSAVQHFKRKCTVEPGGCDYKNSISIAARENESCYANQFSSWKSDCNLYFVIPPHKNLFKCEKSILDLVQQSFNPGQ